MRRHRPSSYYHDRTKTIVDQHYSEWQLTRTDEREGIHSLINRAVVAVEDLALESKYIENKFFPDSISIDEPWLLYKIKYSPSFIYLTSGALNSSVSASLPEAASLDEFIDGYYTTCTEESVHLFLSGSADNITSIRSATEHYKDELVLQYGNKYVTYSLGDESITDSGDLILSLSGEMEFNTDINNRVFPLEIELPSSYSLVNDKGVDVEHTFITSDNSKGYYDSNLDIDKDGIIGDKEYRAFMKLYGTKMTDYTPSEWDEISWADINKDDKIDDKDLKTMKAVVPSLRSDIKSALSITDRFVGHLTLTYSIVPEEAYYIYRNDSSYFYNTSSSKTLDYGKVCAFDTELNVYYILDTVTNTLRTVSSTGELYSMMYVPAWTSGARMIDIDSYEHFLYVLSYDGSTCRVYFSEILDESKAIIDDYISFQPKKAYGQPLHFTLSKDNSFIVLYENALIRYKFSRNNYYYSEETGYTFFHTKPSVFNNSGEAVEPERHYVFNSFDSFAYSLGINRPYGSDNSKMREIIYDFFKYPQDLSKSGITYGIMRELGYTNKVFNNNSTIYQFPGKLSSGEYISINGTSVFNTGAYPIVVPNVGTVGPTTITFTRDFLKDHSDSTVTVSSHFSDMYKNSNAIDVEFELPEFSDKPLVEVHSYRDTDFLEEHGYLVSGVPSEKFLELVDTMETNSAFTYGNCIPDVSIFGCGRIPTVPRVPTIFDTMVRSSGEVEVVIE